MFDKKLRGEDKLPISFVCSSTSRLNCYGAWPVSLHTWFQQDGNEVRPLLSENYSGLWRTRSSSNLLLTLTWPTILSIYFCGVIENQYPCLYNAYRRGTTSSTTTTECKTQCVRGMFQAWAFPLHTEQRSLWKSKRNKGKIQSLSTKFRDWVNNSA
jgi:hypothetical protein